MVLSDRTIREELDKGGIVIEPLAEQAMQPSSVDLRVDRLFRVFRNDTTPYIDPKRPQEDLTELVEVEEGEAFILHPGEFVLGSTLERVALGNDLVARLEGKSSLGRLGLLIHSSLPAGEPVLTLIDDKLEPRPIGEIVRERRRGYVVGFDPETFEVGYHEITGFYEGPADRIYEVRMASGRTVRVTAGHNLFTRDRDGALTKVRTGALAKGTRVAIPARIPDPADAASEAPELVAALTDQLVAAGNPSVLPPDRLPVDLRERAGLKQNAASRLAGYRHATDLAKIEKPANVDGDLLWDDGDLLWDTVVEVRDTERSEPIFDLEVRPGGRRIENFLAGVGGVFVSNTAGFVDAGWDGHLTLELSNVANLPIAIYPGMKIGQISFLRMSTEAESPYGSGEAGSKYKGQEGPTPSRYYLNFEQD